MDSKIISEVMRELGRRGGKVGGKRRLDTMTSEERRDVARKAGLKSAEVRAKKKAAELRPNKVAAKSVEVRTKKAAAKKKATKRT